MRRCSTSVLRAQYVRCICITGDERSKVEIKDVKKKFDELRQEEMTGLHLQWIDEDSRRGGMSLKIRSLKTSQEVGGSQSRDLCRVEGLRAFFILASSVFAIHSIDHSAAVSGAGALLWLTSSLQGTHGQPGIMQHSVALADFLRSLLASCWLRDHLTVTFIWARRVSCYPLELSLGQGKHTKHKLAYIHT